ncbi:MAG TPA: VWA domain-containing protein [Chloroflexota bacterium]
MPRLRALFLRALFLGLLLLLLWPIAAQAQQPDDPPTDVLFVLDSSASMSRDDSRGQASDPRGLRLSAVRAFITLATGRMRIGLLNLSDAYSGHDGLDQPTALQTGLVQGLTDASPPGKAALLQAVNGIKTTHEAGLDDGFTYMTRALDLAGRVMAHSKAAERYVIVLSDGDVTGENPRAWWESVKGLQASGVRVVVFRLGRREPPGLTNRELAALDDQLAPRGAARVVERPEDLLGYYLQTFVSLRRDTYVNALGPLSAGADRQLLDVRDWMDVSEIHLLIPSGGEKPAGQVVTGLVGEKLGRDVAGEARGELGADPNLEMLSLSRERLGGLEGIWRIALAGRTGDVQVVFRSRVRITPDPLLRPGGTDLAVVSVRTADGGKPIPNRAVVARGAAGEEPTTLLPGAFGADVYSGVVRPDRDGMYRVGVTSADGGGQPAAERSAGLPPFLEKAFPVGTTDKVALDDVALAFERVGGDTLLKAGQPLRVRVTGRAGSCQIGAAALRVDATYPSPAPGLPPRESGLAAQPLGQAPGGGLLYGFVPQGPGQVTFGIDHGLVRCADVELPIGIPTGGRGTGTQTFDVDVERALKVDRDAGSPRELGPLPPGTDAVDVLLKYELASWRPERIALSVEGLAGASSLTPTIDLAVRDGAGRPGPRAGTLPVKIRLGGPQPGGAGGTFTLVARRVEASGAAVDLGRHAFSYAVAPSAVGVNVSRDPVVSPEGVILTIALDTARLALIAPSTGQDFEIVPSGPRDARVEPKVLRVAPGTGLVEHRVFVQTTGFCDQAGAFGFGLELRPLASPNGQVVVVGSPLQVSVRLPKMDVTLTAPERIGALRPGVALPITLQSSSLCPESLRLRLTEPADPVRFADSGLSAPQVLLGPGAGEIRAAQVAPVRPAARGQGGVLRLEAIRQEGHPSTAQPEPVEIRYYTPLWTEEFPDLARLVFGLLAAGLTLVLALPRILFADPLVAHRDGDSSVVSGRRRLRWLVLSAVVSAPLAFAIVYWAMARFLP